MKIDGQIETKLRLLRLTGMLQTLPVRVNQAQEAPADTKKGEQLWENHDMDRSAGRVL